MKFCFSGYLTKTEVEPDVNIFTLMTGGQRHIESDVMKKFCQKAICLLSGLNPEFQGRLLEHGAHVTKTFLLTI